MNYSHTGHRHLLLSSTTVYDIAVEAAGCYCCDIAAQVDRPGMHATISSIHATVINDFDGTQTKVKITLTQ